eukprot:TRINITY_DN57253_c0_g1_i1.p1 TRINITY_DN57253_c0_g1~~TRINITY_DN57253_c0_g1_i1.p1  ORF type:complete len:110 (+),score=9.88 TRINITY_DN57253_c0_g1_i1:99-428(+)
MSPTEQPTFIVTNGGRRISQAEIESLDQWFMRRPSIEEAMKSGILQDPYMDATDCVYKPRRRSSVSPSIAVAIDKLEQNRRRSSVKDTLESFLMRRPEREQLVERNILI